MWRTKRTRVWRLAGGLLACGVVLAACTGSPSATPTASPSPEPTTDIASVFVVRLSSPGFEARSDVSGTITLGAVEGAIEGEYLFSRADYSSSLLLEIAGVSQQQNDVSVDGERFTSSDDGPWVLQDAQPDADAQAETLTEVLSGIQSLEDAGEIEKFGRTLHQLLAADPVELDASSLGLTDPSISDVAGTMEFYAEADGTPAGFSIQVTWTQEVQSGTSVEAEMVMDFEFTDLEGPIDIARPDPVWLRYTSERWGYTVAYPEVWTLDESNPLAEQFLLPDNSAYAVVAHVNPLPEFLSQAGFEADSQAGFAAQGATALTSSRYPMGAEDGLLVVYTLPDAGGELIIFNIAVYHAGVGYDIQVGARNGEGVGESLADALDWLMTTFAFTQ